MAVSPQRGVTLIELVITLTFIAITLTVAVPSFERLTQSSRVTETQNALLADLYLARSEAVSRGLPTIVCNGQPKAGCDSDNGWENGWYIAVVPRGVNTCQDTAGDGKCDSHGGQIIQRKSAIPDSLTLDGNGSLLISRVRFQPNGFAQGYAGTLSICDESGTDTSGSGIVINVTGRMRRAQPGDLSC